MAMYTFYPCNLDGGSNSFEVFDLDSDGEAGDHARQLLAAHPACAYVAVWDSERLVLERHRARPVQLEVWLGV